MCVLPRVIYDAVIMRDASKVGFHDLELDFDSMMLYTRTHISSGVVTLGRGADDRELVDPTLAHCFYLIRLSLQPTE